MFPYTNLKIVRNQTEKENTLSSLLTVQTPTVVSFLNAHAVTCAVSDPAFMRNLLAAPYLLRDGIGLATLLKVLGHDPGWNMNGTDLIPEILAAFAGRRVALCGTQEPWLSRARDAVEAMGGRVVLCLDGFRAPDFYGEALSACEADLVILAMGMPKQEAVASLLVDILRYPVVIVNGGAILDFLAKRFPRAPVVWREAHLEWLFRLIGEPWRLSRRYLWGGLKLAFLTGRLLWAQKASVSARNERRPVPQRLRPFL